MITQSATSKVAAQLCATSALRALVLLLIVLLLIFVGLMHVTGEYQVGGPVLGSILLIGLGAANCAR